MNSLKLLKLSFVLSFQDERVLPPFVGNTIRGALGKALNDNFPAVYDAVFKVKGGESVPNPFVISTPYPGRGSYSYGESLTFNVTLFGSACKYAENIAAAAELMGKGKLAGAMLTQSTIEYYQEWSDAGADAAPPCDRLTLNFITPTELLSSKDPVYEPEFGQLMDRLFGRISTIFDYYGDRELVIPYSLIGKKPFVRAEYDIKKVQINSNQQPIDGFIGTIRYFGDVTRYLPYIDLGSQVHLGKKTTRSCGEFTFDG